MQSIDTPTLIIHRTDERWVDIANDRAMLGGLRVDPQAHQEPDGSAPAQFGVWCASADWAGRLGRRIPRLRTPLTRRADGDEEDLSLSSGHYGTTVTVFDLQLLARFRSMNAISSFETHRVTLVGPSATPSVSTCTV